MTQYEVTEIARRLIDLPVDSRLMFEGIPAPDAECCAHCGRPRRGGARINDAQVCHTSPPFPDCYRLVTVYGERLGERHPQRVRERIETDIEAWRSEQESDVLTAGAWSDGVRFGLTAATQIVRGPEFDTQVEETG